MLKRLLLRLARKPALELVNDLLDVVLREALEVVDGKPNAAGELGTLERLLTPEERAAATSTVTAVVARLRSLAQRALA